MNAFMPAAHQGDDFTYGVLVDAQIQVEKPAVPPPPGFHAAQPAGRPVGAGRLAGETDLPFSRSAGGIDIEIHVGQVKDRFCVAKLKIDPPQDVDGREGAENVACQQRFEIPPPRLGTGTRLYQVDAGIFQSDGRKLEPAPQDSPDLETRG